MRQLRPRDGQRGQEALPDGGSASLRAVDSHVPPLSGLSRRWRTRAADMDSHLLTFSAYWLNGVRYPRRRAIQLEVAAIDSTRQGTSVTGRVGTWLWPPTSQSSSRPGRPQNRVGPALAAAGIDRAQVEPANSTSLTYHPRRAVGRPVVRAHAAIRSALFPTKVPSRRLGRPGRVHLACGEGDWPLGSATHCRRSVRVAPSLPRTGCSRP